MISNANKLQSFLAQTSPCSWYKQETTSKRRWKQPMKLAIKINHDKNIEITKNYIRRRAEESIREADVKIIKE